MNDVIKRKDYVDALNNKYKDVFLRAVRNLKSGYPDIEVTAFSDYKGLRLLFESKTGQKIPAELAETLGVAYKKSLTEYAEYLRVENLVYATDDPKLWFRSGIGSTADRATLAARYSRVIEAEPGTAVFEDPKVEMHVRHGLEITETARRAIMEGHPELFENAGGLRVPSAEVLDLVRKTADARELRNALAQRYNLTSFSARDATDLQSYVQRLNQFTPSVLTAERGSATLAEAHTGGFSIDLAGQGGENLRAVAIAIHSLIRTKTVNVSAIETESFVQTLRRQDLVATASLEARKAEVRAAVEATLGKDAVVKISGDDIVVIPKQALTAAEQKAFLDKLSKTTGGGGLRATYIDGSKASAGRLDALATWAEGQEKVLRGQVEGVIPREKLRSIIFSSSVTEGKLRFEYHYRNSNAATQLTEAEERRLKIFMQKVESEGKP